MKIRKELVFFIVVITLVIGFLFYKIYNREIVIVKNINLTSSNIDFATLYENIKSYSKPFSDSGATREYKDGSTEATYSIIINGIKYTFISKTSGGFMDSEIKNFSDLYVEKENRRVKLLSNIWGTIYSLNFYDMKPGFSKGYVDMRGNLYVLQQEGVIYIIREGNVIGKINNIGENNYTWRTNMVSDKESTYIINITEKIGGSVGSREIFYSHPNSVKNIKNQFKIDI